MPSPRRVTERHMRNRRGDHWSPAARPEPAQGAATHPLIITWAADDRPYGINIAGEFTFGGVRAEGELPARAREATLECPALRKWFIDALIPNS